MGTIEVSPQNMSVMDAGRGTKSQMRESSRNATGSPPAPAACKSAYSGIMSGSSSPLPVLRRGYSSFVLLFGLLMLGLSGMAQSGVAQSTATPAANTSGSGTAAVQQRQAGDNQEAHREAQAHPPNQPRVASGAHGAHQAGFCSFKRAGADGPAIGDHAHAGGLRGSDRLRA